VDGDALTTMTPREIAGARLAHQQIAQAACRDPAGTEAHLGAMQIWITKRSFGRLDCNCPAQRRRTSSSPSRRAPSAELAKRPSAHFPNWWADNPSPNVAEGPHSGARTVSRWREEYLRDFAAHLDRCKSPAPAWK
jgi:hypothetical protein